MPEFVKCWNEACLSYGQTQPKPADGRCPDCGQQLFSVVSKPLTSQQDRHKE